MALPALDLPHGIFNLPDICVLSFFWNYIFHHSLGINQKKQKKKKKQKTSRRKTPEKKRPSKKQAVKLSLPTQAVRKAQRGPSSCA